VAANVPDLLRQLDGRTVRRFDGRTVVMRTGGAEVTPITMTRRQRFLSAIAHPQIAYLLLSLGILGLTVELWNPGAILPGVVGGVALLLAFFALQVLPVNTIGILLIVFGLVLLILELKVASFGALGIGGTVSLVVGSVMLTRSVPGIPVRMSVTVSVAISLAAIFLFLGHLALRAQRAPAATGLEALIGVEARTLTSIAPHIAGQVAVHGEIWRALSRAPLSAGARVRIAAVDGLTLLVEPLGE
jgi:membrane-bound serine protease (ClpP class)